DLETVVRGRRTVLGLELQEPASVSGHRRPRAARCGENPLRDHGVEDLESLAGLGPPGRRARARSHDEERGHEQGEERAAAQGFFSPAIRSISSRAWSTMLRSDRNTSTESARPPLNNERPRPEKATASSRTSSPTAGPAGFFGFL